MHAQCCRRNSSRANIQILLSARAFAQHKKSTCAWNMYTGLLLVKNVNFVANCKLDITI